MQASRRDLQAKRLQAIDERRVALQASLDHLDWWRLFINGEHQEKGRDLFKHIHDGQMPSQHYLQTNQWSLTEKEYSDYTLVDLKQLDRGWMPYERNESGYLKAMMTSFQYAMSCPDEEITSDLIKQIHALAVMGVKGLPEYEGREESLRSEYRHVNATEYRATDNMTKDGLASYFEGDNGFVQIECIVRANRMRFRCYVKMSPESFAEFKAKEGAIDEPFFNKFVICNMGNHENLKAEITAQLNKASYIKKIRMVDTLYQALEKSARPFILLHGGFPLDMGAVDYTPAEIEERRMVMLTKVEKLTAEFNHAIKTPSRFDKLKAIIDLVQKCEKLHPFADGNTRTFSMVMMNFLLAKHGFSFVIQDNPNLSGVTSLNEHVDKILKSMENALNLIEHKKLYGFATQDVVDYLESNSGKGTNADMLAYFKQTLELAPKQDVKPAFGS